MDDKSQLEKYELKLVVRIYNALAGIHDDFIAYQDTDDNYIIVDSLAKTYITPDFFNDLFAFIWDSKHGYTTLCVLRAYEAHKKESGSDEGANNDKS